MKQRHPLQLKQLRQKQHPLRLLQPRPLQLLRPQLHQHRLP
jgi:hypothetical protein